VVLDPSFQLESLEDAEEHEIQYVTGDATKPDPQHVSLTQKAAIVVNCVDNSGVWGRGGMFDAVVKICPASSEE
jgi:chromodomain-helicase-DNA-binding protein 1-like